MLARNTHLLMEERPYMFDGTTLTPSLALAVKSIGASGDDPAKAIVLEAHQVGNRGGSSVKAQNYLNSAGLETLTTVDENSATTEEDQNSSDSPADSNTSQEEATEGQDSEAQK